MRLEELLFERGVVVIYATILVACTTSFGTHFAHRVNAQRRNLHFDEMFVPLRGDPYLLWRAADEHGAELDILRQERCDKAAAKRFFKRPLGHCEGILPLPTARRQALTRASSVAAVAVLGGRGSASAAVRSSLAAPYVQVTTMRTCAEIDGFCLDSLRIRAETVCA